MSWQLQDLQRPAPRPARRRRLRCPFATRPRRPQGRSTEPGGRSATELGPLAMRRHLRASPPGRTESRPVRGWADWRRARSRKAQRRGTGWQARRRPPADESPLRPESGEGAGALLDCTNGQAWYVRFACVASAWAAKSLHAVPLPQDQGSSTVDNGDSPVARAKPATSWEVGTGCGARRGFRRRGSVSLASRSGQAPRSWQWGRSPKWRRHGRTAAMRIWYRPCATRRALVGCNQFPSTWA